MLGHLWKDGPDTAMRCIGFQTMLIRGCQWAATGKVSFAMPKDFPTADEVKLAGEATPREPAFDITAKKPKESGHRAELFTARGQSPADATAPPTPVWMNCRLFMSIALADGVAVLSLRKAVTSTIHGVAARGIRPLLSSARWATPRRSESPCRARNQWPHFRPTIGLALEYRPRRNGFPRCLPV